MTDATETLTTTHTYSANIDDFEAGSVTVTEYRAATPTGVVAVSGDAVTASDGPLTDAQIGAWLQTVSSEEWASPDTRRHDDLTIEIVRA